MTRNNWLSWIVMAGFLAGVPLAVAGDKWDDGAPDADDMGAKMLVASTNSNLAELGVKGPGADGVARTIKSELAKGPAGSKVRFSLTDMTEGSARWRNLYLRSIVLLDEKEQPNGVETFVIEMSVSGEVAERREIPWAHGLREGVEKHFRGNVVLGETPWQKGKIEGVKKTFHPSGQVATETTFVGGEANGPVRVYEADGTLVRDGTMKNDRREGPVTEYWAPGKPKKVVPYRDGKAEGVLKEYYQSGKLKREIGLKNDSYHGEEKQYNEDGKVSLTRYWINGDSVSEQEFKKNAGK
jgi:antitoxin component YwqK of YwqJK toxin-antitoxin module